MKSIAREYWRGFIVFIAILANTVAHGSAIGSLDGPTAALGDSDDEPVKPALAVEQIYAVPALNVKAIVINGSKLISDSFLRRLQLEYVERDLTVEDIQILSDTLTKYFFEQGYINTFVVAPEQELVNGVLILQVIEGRLAEVNTLGNRDLSTSYIASYFSSLASTPLQFSTLNESLTLLGEHERVSSIDVTLHPGQKPGDTRLDLFMQESSPSFFSVEANNFQSPSIGAYQLGFHIGHAGLFRSRQKLELSAIASEGSSDYGLRYELPVSVQDTRLVFDAHTSEYRIIEKPFDKAELESESVRSNVSLQYSLTRTYRTQGELLLAVDGTHARTYIAGEPMGLSPGVRDDGIARTFAAQIGTQWRWRGGRYSYATKLLWEKGLDVNGATIDESKPDGLYQLVAFDFSAVHTLWGNQYAIWHVNAQLADEALLPAKKYAIGGARSVRGYRQNLGVRDNGVMSSIEIRMTPGGQFYVVPFVDFGEAWASSNFTPRESRVELYSAGVGITWSKKKNIGLELYWAKPLNELEDSVIDWEGEAVSFSVSYRYE